MVLQIYRHTPAARALHGVGPLKLDCKGKGIRVFYHSGPRLASISKWQNKVMKTEKGNGGR